jgi:predicted O-linked N-acetylglucosamine transferase (SPINDLY family)
VIYAANIRPTSLLSRVSPMSFVSKILTRKRPSSGGTDSGGADEWRVVVVNATSAIQLGDYQHAVRLYDGFIERNPDHADAHYKRAVAFNALGKLQSALSDYERAIALNPRHAYAFCNRGSVLERMDRKEDAVRSYDAALAIDPKDHLAHYNRGTVLKQLGRPLEALGSFDKAILMKPDYAEAYVNRGNVLQEMWRHEEAIQSFARAIELKPIFAEAFQGRGASLRQLKRLQAAIDDFGQALALNPRQKFLTGMRRYLQMQICDWSAFDADMRQLTADVQAGLPVGAPLPMLTLTDEASLHKIAAELWIRSECSSSSVLGPIESRRRGEKIKIGYFSPDFRNHPVSQLTTDLFERHDRERFELTAFALGPPVHDTMRTRLQSLFDAFIDVQNQSDLEVASLARRLEIDIAVDLGGLTENCRTKIFALRAAPIQISFLGYPGTMGADFIDYLIADRMVVPESQQAHYSEKIIYLPGCYLPSDLIRPPGVNPFTRKELGLPENAFVFCCFNNTGKLMPDTFESWTRILRQVEDSVLWLPNSNAAATDNLRREITRRGIAPERLIFASRIDSLAEHRARLGHADLFLDTFPYNAHATALDAVWAGLPMVTRMGESFAARVAASLLTAIGLPEVITTSAEHYEELAVQLARDPGRLADLRAKLLRNRSATQAFDVPRFAANLESAYRVAFERYLQGSSPDHIHLDRDARR